MESQVTNQSETLIQTPQQLFVVVLLSFFVPLAFILLVVKLITGGINISPDALTEKAVSERMKPVGSIQIAGSVDALNPPIPLQETASLKPPKNGETVYQQVCAVCHIAGVAGAPRAGDKSQWEARIAKGKKVLYQNAINGIGIMPAKGGATTLSDDEIKAAVDYLLKQ